MSISLPIKNMTFEEKIQTMELLWEDLCSNATAIKSPAWHEDVLTERALSINEGTAEYIDWETAKKDIRKEIE